MNTEILTQDYLKEIFEYRDGELYWKISKAQKLKIGQIAGGLRNDGRKATKINNKLYLNHRLIFFYHYGYFPTMIDHIDLNPLNNKIENLREVTRAQNNWNTLKPIRNKSGIKNVSWHKASKKWAVQIGVNGKNKILGYFADIELAELVAVEARNKYHGIYARHS
jgi:hypothetical protein